jgi:nucleoside-diphosphate-sugar epimerase
LITGGTGFLGAEIARVLVEHEDERVVLLDTHPDEDAVRDLGASATVVRGDFSDPVDLLRVLSGENFTAIVHLAYVIGEAARFPGLAIRVNCSGTNLLFEAAMARGIRRVVWASSAAVYGGVMTSASPDWVTEDAPCNPTGIYGACKLFNENNAEIFARQRDFDHVALRMPATFGPRRYYRRAIDPDFYAAFFVDAPAGRTTIAPPADHVANWSYYKDVAEAYHLALTAERPAHRIYNVPGTASTTSQAVTLMTGLMPTTRVQYSSTAQPHLAFLNGDRIAEDLGFKPNPSLAEIFAACLSQSRQAPSDTNHMAPRGSH